MAKPKTCKSCGHEFFIDDQYYSNWKNFLMPCPKCSETFCVMKPLAERDLQRLQYRYKGCTSEKLKTYFYNQMYTLLIEYTKSLILKHYSNLIDSSETLDEKASDAVHFLLEEYLKNISFNFDISFGGFLIDKIRQVMFSKKYHNAGTYSLNYKFSDDNEVEWEDTKDYLHDIEKKQDTGLTVSYLINLIINYKKECNDRRENVRRLLAVNFFLTHGERKVDNFFRVYGRYGKMRYEETIMLLKHELKRLEKDNK